MDFERVHFGLLGQLAELFRREGVHHRNRCVKTGQSVAGKNPRQQEYGRMRDAAPVQIIDHHAQPSCLVYRPQNHHRLLPTEMMQGQGVDRQIKTRLPKR